MTCWPRYGCGRTGHDTTLIRPGTALGRGYTASPATRCELIGDYTLAATRQAKGPMILGIRSMSDSTPSVSHPIWHGR